MTDTQTGPDDARPPKVTNDLVLSIIATAEADEIDRPHIVVCHDAATGHTLYIGPYPRAADALVAADADAAATTATEAYGTIRRSYSVAPLHLPVSGSDW
jgi:hypothetical protein